MIYLETICRGQQRLSRPLLRACTQSQRQIRLDAQAGNVLFPRPCLRVSPLPMFPAIMHALNGLVHAANPCQIHSLDHY